jgi:ankyrin repeat protein
VRLLVEHGADVDTKKGDGSTPLYIACQENRLNVVNYLLSRGAKVEATFKTGVYACTRAYMLQVGQVWCSMRIVVDVSSLNAFRACVCVLHHFAGFTSMYIASQKGHLGIVKTLLEHQANIDAAAGLYLNAM